MAYNPTLADIRNYFSSLTRQEITTPSLTRAGVLIPLFEQEGNLHVILTQRTEEVEHHKGQISFPGGVMDAQDETIIDTALREAEEEIGLAPSSVQILGILSDLSTPSGFCITPVVGVLSCLPTFCLNANEVAEILTVPLSFFLESANERTELRIRNGQEITVYFFQYGKFEIWGATAAIIRAFVHNLRNLQLVKKPL
jgi:8-oxo-dGTP pyrophosphatase MutT (NUDIX family)